MKSERKFVVYGVVYAIVLLSVQFIFFYRGTPTIYNLSGNGINLIPFRTLAQYIKYYDHFNKATVVKQIISCFALLPLSIVLGFSAKDKALDRKKYLLYFFLTALLTSFLSRVTQVGVFEIDHVIFRTIVGFGFFCLFKKWSTKNEV